MSEPTRISQTLAAMHVIPEWLFRSSSYVASKDPVEVRDYCPLCGVIEPKQCANGYLRRECEHKREARYAAQNALAMTKDAAMIAAKHVDRTYTWLGGEEDELAAKTFAGFEKKVQPKAYAYVQMYVSQIIQATSTKGLDNIILAGVYGTGKTHLLAAILNELRTHGIGCLFCTAPELFDALYAASFEQKQKLLLSAQTTPLFGIDDLDKLHTRAESEEGSYQKSTLYTILDKRYKAQLPTIITTNAAHDLKKWLDGATLSRLSERMSIQEMNGVDYRLAKRKAGTK